MLPEGSVLSNCGVNGGRLALALCAALAWVAGAQARAADVTVSVDGTQTRQTMEGFGGAEGWLYPPNEAIRSQIFDELGVSLLRYRPLPNLEMSNGFNGNEALDNDNNDPSVIDWGKLQTGFFDNAAPLLKAAQKRGVTLITSVHSAPIWMSTATQDEKDKGILKPGYENELAEWIVMWVKGMQLYHGVRFDYTSLHNEPEVSWSNGSWLYYSSGRYRDVLKRLGSRFQAEGLATKLCGPETTSIGGMAPGGYADAICQDPVAKGYLARLACHSYTSASPDATIPQWQAAAGVAATHGKPLWEMEMSGQGANWGGGMLLAQYLHNAVVYGGVTAWFEYEVYRDPNGTNYPALIELAGPNATFYAMKQYFRYVRPGAVRLDAPSSDGNVMITAFKHEGQGTFTVVMMNRDAAAAKTVSCSLSNLPGAVASLSQYRSSATENCVALGTVAVSGGSFSATLPANSITTFTGALGAQKGTLQFSAANWSAWENGAFGTNPLTIVVTRTGGSSGTVSVNYATSNGTATAGSDYTAASGTLTWADGDVSNKTFSVSVADDAVLEGNETVNLTLSSATGGAALGSPATAVLTIIERAGDLGFSAANYSVNEDGGTATLTVRRTNGHTGAVAVGYQTVNQTAAAGVDYTAASGTLSWANEDVADKTFTVPILDNALYAGNKTLAVVLGNPTGGAMLKQRTAVLTIVDNEPAPAAGALVFGPSGYCDGRYRVMEAADLYTQPNLSPVTITVKRVGGSAGVVSVNYATSNGTATAGSDYTTASGTLSWADGETADKTFTVASLNDSIYEGDETVNLTLSNPTGGAVLTPQSTAVLIVMDNDPPPAAGSLQFSAAAYSVNENGGTATITVMRAGGITGAVSVHYATSNGTAAAGSDYTAASGTLSWANGETAAKTFTVPILDDAVYEGNETVNLALSSPAGGATLGLPGSAVLAIADNEAPPRTKDFNGDRKADMLFRHPSSGAVYLWLMQ